MLLCTVYLSLLCGNECVVVTPDICDNADKDNDHQHCAQEVKHIHAHSTSAMPASFVLEFSQTELLLLLFRWCEWHKLSTHILHRYNLHLLSIRSIIHHHLAIRNHLLRLHGCHLPHLSTLRRTLPPRLPPVHRHQLLLVVWHLLRIRCIWVHLVWRDVFLVLALIDVTSNRFSTVLTTVDADRLITGHKGPLL